MRKNILREKIDNGEPTIGTRVVCPWPSLIEVIGLAKTYDYIEFSGEYSSFTLHDLDNIARACELENLSSMIKVDQSLQRFLAQRSLGSGFQNILFTDVRTVEDAEECVRAVRAETPQTKGINPAWMRRSTGFFKDSGSSEYVERMDDVIVAIMLEKKEAIENMREILSVEGIDMVQFGPTDYSMSLGVPGQRSYSTALTNHSDVLEVENKIIETAFEFGVIPRAEITTPEQARNYLELGVSHFNIGMDIKILYKELKENGEGLKQIINESL